MSLSKRLIVLIDPAMMTWLRERSALAGCSVAEIVRRSVSERMTDTGMSRVMFDIEDLGQAKAEQIQEAEAEKA
jgi:hypothetical protein